MAIEITNQVTVDKAALETIPCIFCGLGSDDIVVKEDGYTARKCPSCGLVYLSPRPIAQAVIDLYGRDNARVSAASHLAAGTLKRFYAKHHLSILNRYVRQGELLEIGAGAGFFLDEARKKGFDVHGIELNPAQASHVRHTLKIPCEDKPLEMCSFGEKKFDVIYHCDVISHFHDPIEEFRKINRKMKHNGLLIFETGNFGDVEEKYYSAYTRFQFPDHLFLFGERNLRDLLARSGFHVEHIYRFSILAQLSVLKTTAVLRRILRSTQIPIVWFLSRIGGILFAQGPSNTGQRMSRIGRCRRILKQINRFSTYLIRYRVGAIMPKRGRPLTLIVTARKRHSEIATDKMQTR